MSRILMCTMLGTLLLSGGPAAAQLSDGSVEASSAALAGVQGPEETDHPGDQAAVPARKFAWPLPGAPAVLRAFQEPAHRFGPGHRGVDLAGTNGAPVLAAGAGTVVFAGQVAGRGVVSIDHPGGGLRTTYEPISPGVTAGDLVAGGQQIGTLVPGHPGCASEVCLHWGVRRGTDYLDPLRLLGLGRVRLLPWEGSSAEG